ncbi:FAD-dependent oxidoreductase [Candidimonas sp. SYP-B2681]|uniref:hydroxysqualene dehydroxylase HpnE n=1 Tax=Candidimonas sp. SYP-B2681 TaxID=2497686 RepID=UPI000F884627|nr:hydroxysqualene dehydroxylase HpnE [Candidimonas sp. SYP-B2681]RTZ44446.1 FAD-dependent oxidoreductase [Candidimonas sp. SYP-B2681]
MNIAVVGAGWAGLSAAVRLRQKGYSVVVFEASRALGGRARHVHSRTLNSRIDNGQHILLGAYSETLALMTTLGLDSAALLHRAPLSLESTDGSFALHVGSLPAPLHLISAIMTARGLSIVERIRIITLTRSLQRRNWKVKAGLTVSQWLHQGGQSAQVICRFWEPLCLAALNTPVQDACAQLFARVLQDSLGGSKEACDVLIPRVDLSQLWPEHVEHYAPGGPASLSVRRGKAVRHLAATSTQVELDGMGFDAVVVAANAPSAHRLLQQLAPTQSGDLYLESLARFTYIPIATLTLQLERPWHLPAPMLLLTDKPEQLQFGQWLFDRSSLMTASELQQAELTDHQDYAACQINIVISDARSMMRHPLGDVVAAITAQLQQQTRRLGPMPAVVGHEVIVEKRATFAALPGLKRPSNDTPWPRIWVAGDWTDTGYPAVLEGAVRSGRNAANAVQRALSSSSLRNVVRSI